MSSWPERIRTSAARRMVVGVIVVLVGFAVLLLWAATQINPSNATDDAARLQALAAVGGLIATVVLIGITAAYVALTGDMVLEAREARLDAIRPALALRIDPVGPVNNVFTVVSVGQGTARDVDVTVSFQPAQPGGYSHEARWRSPSLAPGQSAQFMPKNPAGQVELNTKAVVGLFSRVTVSGTMTDVVGQVHTVEIALDDLSEWQALLAAASQRYVEPPTERIAKTLDKIERKLP